MFNFFDGVIVRNKFGFSLNMFRLAFIHLTHLLVEGLLNMVFEHLQDLFDLKDSASNFFQLFLMCFYVATSCILENIIMAFGVAKLLILAKPFGGIRPITVGEFFYQLVSRTLCL
jgi:hypothetical protein